MARQRSQEAQDEGGPAKAPKPQAEGSVLDLEGLLAKYGGADEVNALWARVAGRPFLSPEQAATLVAAPSEELWLGGRVAVLLGTAHTSRGSAKAAEAWVKQLRPKALLLERCPERLAELAWPKALVMDRTAALRAVEVAGLGEMSSETLRCIPAPKAPPSAASLQEARALASSLWAEFELLNTERNGQVEEAALDAWTAQLDGSARPLLALGDLRTSASGVPAGEGGGGPDREALLASLPSRDAHLAGSVATCLAGSGGPVLAVLGQNHLPGVARALVDAFGASRRVEGGEAAVAAQGRTPAQLPAAWSGAFLRREAVAEIAALRSRRTAALTTGSLRPETALDEYIEAVEDGDSLFRTLEARGWAGEVRPSSQADGAAGLSSGLQAWADGSGPWPSRGVPVGGVGARARL